MSRLSKTDSAMYVVIFPLIFRERQKEAFYTCVCVCVCVCVCFHTHARACTHARARTHAHTHARTHTRTRTHAHTNTDLPCHGARVCERAAAEHVLHPPWSPDICMMMSTHSTQSTHRTRSEYTQNTFCILLGLLIYQRTRSTENTFCILLGLLRYA